MGVWESFYKKVCLKRIEVLRPWLTQLLCCKRRSDLRVVACRDIESPVFTMRKVPSVPGPPILVSLVPSDSPQLLLARWVSGGAGRNLCYHTSGCVVWTPDFSRVTDTYMLDKTFLKIQDKDV